MSGGSYNYLCHVADIEGPLKLVDRQHDLEAMRDALAAEGAEDAAKATEALREELAGLEKQFTDRVHELAKVWKALEWWHSLDWGEERFREALETWRASQ